MVYCSRGPVAHYRPDPFFMPEAPPLPYPIGEGPNKEKAIGGPYDLSWQRSPKNGWKRRAKKKKSPQCHDCNRRCEWRQTKNGRWALWSRGTWHWWNCPKQAELRRAYNGQRRLNNEAATKAAIDP